MRLLYLISSFAALKRSDRGDHVTGLIVGHRVGGLDLLLRVEDVHGCGVALVVPAASAVIKEVGDLDAGVSTFLRIPGKAAGTSLNTENLNSRFFPCG